MEMEFWPSIIQDKPKTRKVWVDYADESSINKTSPNTSMSGKKDRKEKMLQQGLPYHLNYFQARNWTET